MKTQGRQLNTPNIEGFDGASEPTAPAYLAITRTRVNAHVSDPLRTELAPGRMDRSMKLNLSIG